LQQTQNQREGTNSNMRSFGSTVLEAGQPVELTMKCIVAIAIAAAFFAFPAAAQDATKGKSSTAPGKTGSTPGHEQTQPGGAKNLAPGQMQTEPGGAKGLAPGADQRKKK
jgi:hypothetical protein